MLKSKLNKISSLINTGELMLLNVQSRLADGGSTKNFTDDLDTESFKAKHLLTIEDGLLKFSGQPFTSALYVSHDKQGFAAFVIQPNESIYIFNHRNKTDKVAHSSFGGLAVRGAGEIKVRTGKLTHISPHSGHYRPDTLNMYRMLEFFARGNVLSPTAIVAMLNNPFETGTPLPPGTFSAPPANNETLRDAKRFWGAEIEACRLDIAKYSNIPFGETYENKTIRLRRLKDAQDGLVQAERELRFNLQPVSFPVAYDCKEFMRLVEREIPMIRNIPQDSADSELDDWLAELEAETTDAKVNPLLAEGSDKEMEDLMRRLAALR